MPSSAAYNLVRNEVRQLDAAMPVYSLKTLEAQLDETLLTDRLIALLSAGFGLLATVLASVGLYGVMAFVVARRKKELGIRLALGAQPGFVIWMVMREVLLLLAIGLAVGIPAAMVLGRYVSSQLYGIQANDPVIASIDDGAARARVGGGGLDSRAPRQPDRSDPGAPHRSSNREPREASGGFVEETLQEPEDLLASFGCFLVPDVVAQELPALGVAGVGVDPRQLAVDESRPSTGVSLSCRPASPRCAAGQSAR